MIKPFKGDYPLTQPFGANPEIYKQFGLLAHNGIDLATPVGTPIIASISGTVIEAVKSGDAGYGKYVKIENDEYGSLTAHLSRVDVEVGQTVTEGQQIGLSGNTGFSTGPHLHWGIFSKPRDRNNGYGGYVDQTNLITTPNVDTIPVNKKVYEELITKLDKQTAQIHELGIERDSLMAKADNLDAFLGTIANKLNCPKEQSSIIQAIEELFSTEDSINNLTNQISTLKKSVADKDLQLDTLSKEKLTLTEALQALKIDFDKLSEEYKKLVGVTPIPLIKIKIWKYLIEIW